MKAKDKYQSWDPLTQAKFLFDLHQQLGNPISWPTAYRLAEQSIKASVAELARIEGS